LDVPVFACTVYDESATLFPHRASGHGAHPKKAVALSRAITEALQSRLTHISGSRDDLYWQKYKCDIPAGLPHNASWKRGILSEEETLTFDSIPEYHGPLSTAHAGIEWIYGILGDKGLTELLAVDLTQESLGVPVVFVFVPVLDFSAKKRLYSPGLRMREYLAALGVT
jgi:ribosomal protein S12 methylthiotransferase accessory factor